MQRQCAFAGNESHGFRRRWMMARKLKRACCCVGILLLIADILLIFIAHKMGKIYWAVHENNNEMTVPGGNEAFCSDLCVNLCLSETKLPTCEVLKCRSNCISSLENMESSSNAGSHSSSGSSGSSGSSSSDSSENTSPTQGEAGSNGNENDAPSTDKHHHGNKLFSQYSHFHTKPLMNLRKREH